MGTLAGICAGVSHAGPGGIRHDASFGNVSNPLSGTNLTIDPGLGRQVGQNLFHSFSSFNVDPGQTVLFQGLSGTQNIIARVTGTGISRIDGTLGVVESVRNENLYLINPNGIIFGKDSQISVAGTFTATTADYLAFGDDAGSARFWASGEGDVSLLTAAPVAFGFLPKPPGRCGTVELEEGALLDPDPDGDGENIGRPDQSLALVGRKILGSATSLSCGDLVLAAAGKGAQELNLHNPVPTTSVSGSIKLNGVEINIAEDSEVIVRSAGDIFMTAGSKIETTSSTGRSDISVHARGSIHLDRSNLNTNNGILEVHADGTIDATRASLTNGGAHRLEVCAGADFVTDQCNIIGQGDIRVSAGGKMDLKTAAIRVESGANLPTGSLELWSDGDIVLSKNTTVASSPSASQDGGRVLVHAGGDLSIPEFSTIRSENSGSGKGGDLVVEAGGHLLLANEGAIFTRTAGSKKGGDICVTAASMSISGGPTSTRVTGIGTTTGSVDATNPALQSGEGGSVFINVKGDVAISEVGQIFATTNQSGKSGSIDFSANSLTIRGVTEALLPETNRPPNYFLTGIIMKGSTGSLGQLGSIIVEVANGISLWSGGMIDATSFSDSTDSQAGAVTVNARTIEADRMESSFFTGIGSGAARVEQPEDGSETPGGGSGGDVKVTADSIILRGGAQIATTTLAGGNAGDIIVRTAQLIATGFRDATRFMFTGESGVIAAAGEGATGDAGDIQILSRPAASGQRPYLELSDRAQVAARSDGSGESGTVEIDWSGGTIDLSDDAAITTKAGPDSPLAGLVSVNARSIFIRSGAEISSSSEGSGTLADPALAGVSITLGQTLQLHGGQITVSSTRGDAGTIKIGGGKMIDLRYGSIVAEAGLNGGNIDIKGNGTLILGDAVVSANAIEEDGGNIDIEVHRYLPGNTIPTASSNLGADGQIEIEAVEILSESEGELEVAPLDLTDSIQPECTQRLPTEAGSFIRAGRGGTRRLPGGFIPSARLIEVPR